MVAEEALRDMIHNWAEHTASIFDGQSRESCEDRLVESFVNSLRIGASIIPEISDVIVGFSWDSENSIHVVSAPDQVTDDMVIVRAKECL